jgi:hypothetical protein
LARRKSTSISPSCIDNALITASRGHFGYSMAHFRTVTVNSAQYKMGERDALWVLAAHLRLVGGCFGRVLRCTAAPQRHRRPVFTSHAPTHEPRRPAARPEARGARGGGIGIGHRSPPGSSEELGWAGCGPGGPTWPLGRLVRWLVTPTGTRAGSLAPLPLPLLRAGGCRPGAEAARVLGS